MTHDLNAWWEREKLDSSVVKELMSLVSKIVKGQAGEFTVVVIRVIV